MSTAASKPTKLSDALAGLGAFAGFLWGGTVGSEDPEIGFWVGALVGALMGAVGGKVAGLALSVAVQVAIIALFLALIVLRIVGIAQFLGA